MFCPKCFVVGLLAVSFTASLSAQDDLPVREDLPIPEDLPVQVFVLAGQSNMQGQGAISNLTHLIEDEATRDEFGHLRNDEGEWIQRDDVWIDCIGREARGKLSVGFGKNEEKIGPELGFGIAVGDATEAPVLIIKTSWGGRSLKKDYLPPSSGGPGPAYTELVSEVKLRLAALGDRFPGYRGQGYELAGFVWFQGWNDMVDREQREKDYEPYATNLANLIRDFRKEFQRPDLPVVIGELGVGGPPKRGAFQAAQARVAGLQEFGERVALVRTCELYDMQTHQLYEDDVWKGPDKEIFYRVGSDRPYHYLGSGKIYYRMGAAFGKQMLELTGK